MAIKRLLPPVLLSLTALLSTEACGTSGGAGVGPNPPGPSGGPSADPSTGAGVGTPANGGSGSEGVAGACGGLVAGDIVRTLSFGGRTRTYRVHVPADLTGPAPLVLAFHGGGHTATGYEGFVHLAPKADSAKFLLVEPEGVGAVGSLSDGKAEVWNAGNCCADASKNNVDDVGFVRAMLDDLAKDGCYDKKRVFATGFSNGGMLSHRLACELSDRIAAIAAVSGGSGATDNDAGKTLFECKPTRPMPILHIHGTQDACYPYPGGAGPLAGVTFEPVEKTIADWRTRNGCSSSAPAQVYATGAASCVRYACPAPGDVTFCKIDGGGHYWPGGGYWPLSRVACGLDQGQLSADLSTNDFIWDYFKAHPMP